MSWKFLRPDSMQDLIIFSLISLSEYFFVLLRPLLLDPDSAALSHVAADSEREDKWVEKAQEVECVCACVWSLLSCPLAPLTLSCNWENRIKNVAVCSVKSQLFSVDGGFILKGRARLRRVNTVSGWAALIATHYWLHSYMLQKWVPVWCLSTIMAFFGGWIKMRTIFYLDSPRGGGADEVRMIDFTSRCVHKYSSSSRALFSNQHVVLKYKHRDYFTIGRRNERRHRGAVLWDEKKDKSVLCGFTFKTLI